MADAGAVGAVFCGCQANVWSLEMLVMQNPRVGYGLTFLQFVVVSICTFPLVFSFRAWRMRPRRLNGRLLGLLCALFWATSALTNVVFSFNISMPMHTTFRSSSLVINLLLGVLFFKKRYSVWQVLSAGLITVGIVLLTLETSKQASSVASTGVGSKQQQKDVPLMDEFVAPVVVQETDSMGDLASTVANVVSTAITSGSQLTGIAILAATVLLSTCLGLIQDKLMGGGRVKSQPAGSSVAAPTVAPAPVWAEAMFYAHALTAPLFLLRPYQVAEDLTALFSATESRSLIILNCLTQLVCVCGVYVLADRTSSFTVTLTLTLRKFMSIAFSVFYFGHYKQLGVVDWVAMGMVAVGGLVYPFVPKAANAIDAEERLTKIASAPSGRGVPPSNRKLKSN